MMDGMTCSEQEVEYHEKDGHVAFVVPGNVEKARSAYAYDPAFNTAVNIYARRNDVMPEEALSNNLRKMLIVRKDLLGFEPDEIEREPESFIDTEVPSIEEIKRMYVSGYIDEEELERMIEETL